MVPPIRRKVISQSGREIGSPLIERRFSAIIVQNLDIMLTNAEVGKVGSQSQMRKLTLQRMKARIQKMYH